MEKETTKKKSGAKPKYKVPLTGMYVRVADCDRDEMKKFEKKLQKKHLKQKK